jgi:hypothetical protein
MSKFDKTFVFAVLAGEATLSQIDEWVEAWHDDKAYAGTLPEYLGMSEREYGLWLSKPRYLRSIVEAHRPAEESAKLFDRLAAADVKGDGE